jgi:hypothetical protein
LFGTALSLTSELLQTVFEIVSFAFRIICRAINVTFKLAQIQMPFGHQIENNVTVRNAV